MPKLAEFDDLGDTPIFNAKRLGVIMGAERDKRDMTRETVAQVLRSRYGIPISERRLAEMEKGKTVVPLDVFLGFVEIVGPFGGISIFTPALTQPALDALGLGKSNE